MSITNNAMLVKLTISQMGLSSKDEAATKIASAALHVGQTDAGYFKKFKLQKKDVAAISIAANNARLIHKNYTVPFGDDNWRLLNSTLVMEYTAKIRECKDQFDKAVNALVASWDDIIKRNKQVLGALFDQADYPEKYNVVNMYDFRTEVRPVPQSDHLLLQIESDTLEKLKRDIDRQHEENIVLIKKDIWKRLYEPVSRMAERLSGEDKVFHSTLVSNIQSIVDILPNLNIASDPDLIRLGEEIKDKLCNYTPDQLRKDKSARKEVAEMATDIVAKMSKMDGFMGVSTQAAVGGP